jgi:hypothetical protein
MRHQKLLVDYLRPSRDVQSDITATMRSILIDWLIEVGEEFNLSNETVFLCSR